MSVELIQCANHEEWLAKRRETIGASEVAAILGLSPWGDDAFSVYCAMKGIKVDVDDDRRRKMALGLLMEPVIAKTYELETGRVVMHSGDHQLFINTGCPWLHASLDCETFKGAPDDPAPWVIGALELKNIGGYGLKAWDDGVPIMHQVQVTVQMVVRELSWGSVAAIIGGAAFRFGDVERSDKFVTKMLAATKEFFERVQNEEPPPPGPSEMSKKLLALLYCRVTQPEGMPVVLPDEASQWHQDRIDAIAAGKEADEKRRQAENLLKAAMGSRATSVFFNGSAAYWWRQSETKYKAKPAVEAHTVQGRRFLCKTGP